MTPSEAAFFRRTHARIARLRPEVIRALIRAWSIIVASFNESELAQIIDSGNVDRLIAEALADQALDRALIPLRLRMRDVMESAFKYTTPSLPRGGKVDGVLAVAFDQLSPDVVTAIRALETPVMARLKQDARDVVRARVLAGIQAGENPRAIARDLRDIIGLGPTQYQEVLNYRDALMGANGRSLSDYTLADATAKRLAAKGPLTEKQIDRYTEAYRQRRIALNAEATARSATLQSFKQGQRLSWQDAIDKGVVPPGRLVKQWIGVMDDRERPEHVAMERQTVPFDEPYSNGEMTPGESTYNCRCVEKVFIQRAT